LRGDLARSGLVDLSNIIRGHIDTDAGLTDVIPVQGMRQRAAPGLCRWLARASWIFPIFHAAKIQDVTHRALRHRLAASSTWWA